MDDRIFLALGLCRGRGCGIGAGNWPGPESSGTAERGVILQPCIGMVGREAAIAGSCVRRPEAGGRRPAANAKSVARRAIGGIPMNDPGRVRIWLGRPPAWSGASGQQMDSEVKSSGVFALADNLPYVN